ncbi:hypothetical protein M5689_025173 [Euphorbia peplus]|nr:hypothetical protein M5689_025173 [Euphorbia peplus]
MQAVVHHILRMEIGTRATWQFELILVLGLKSTDDCFCNKPVVIEKCLCDLLSLGGGCFEQVIGASKE